MESRGTSNGYCMFPIYGKVSCAPYVLDVDSQIGTITDTGGILSCQLSVASCQLINVSCYFARDQYFVYF